MTLRKRFFALGRRCRGVGENLWVSVASEEYIKNFEVEADYQSSRKAIEKIQGFRLSGPELELVNPLDGRPGMKVSRGLCP